jgi:hypothetical protein
VAAEGHHALDAAAVRARIAAVADLVRFVPLAI